MLRGRGGISGLVCFGGEVLVTGFGSKARGRSIDAHFL